VITASEEEITVDTWLIVLIVVAVVVVLALLALVWSKRSKVASSRKREQAREHLHEAELRGARADKERALAEEQAARARRERAEVEERAAVAEQESRDRAARAEEDRSAAEDLRAKAEKLAPGMSRDGHHADGDTRVHEEKMPTQPGGSVPPDAVGGSGATRR
jgi:FtsZ-interacting cell division protein ZipA